MPKKLTFTSHFIPHLKGPFDFFDIPLDKDTEVFIDPFLIANNKTKLNIRGVYDQTVNFLTKLNRSFIQPNDRKNGLIFLSNLHEPNEYHLGYSGDNKGKAISKGKSEVVFEALRKNKATRVAAGITNEAHNVLLLVEGIGPDNVSDIIANVCRNIFAEFTNQVCVKYGIAAIKTPIKYYDPKTKNWVTGIISLPEYNGKKIILIPKIIASGKRAYSLYYNWFIAKNYIAVELMKTTIKPAKTGKTIRTLKDGTKKAIIKEIVKTYGKPKNDLIDFVINYPKSLDEFLIYAKEHYPALDLSGVAE